MSLTIRIVAIVATLAFFKLHDADARVRSINKEFGYRKNQLNISPLSTRDGITVYAVCDKKNLTTEKKCTVIQKTYPYDEIARSCNVTIGVKHPENGGLTKEILVRAFGEDKAILIWDEVDELTKMNAMTIDLNNCNTSLVEIDDASSQWNFFQQMYGNLIVAYNNSYDIFYSGVESDEDDNRDHHGMRVDLDGKTQPLNNAIKNENNYKIAYISSIANQSPDKGYIYSGFGKNSDNNVLLVKPDGSEKILTSTTNPNLVTSANYDLITTCTRTDTGYDIKCTQFDENGQVKFNVTITAGSEKALKSTAVLTIEGGGFLLLTRTFSVYDGEIYTYVVRSCDVIKVDNEGKNVGKVNMKDFAELEGPKSFSLWKKGDEYCAGIVSAIIAPSYLNILANCFTANDLLTSA